MYRSLALTNTSNIELNIYQYGQESCEKSHSFGPAVRQHYLFHYVISGKGVLYTEHGAFPVNPREGFLIYPHDVTTYCADENEPWHYMWLEVDGLAASRIFKECHLSRKSPIYRPIIYSDLPDELRYLQEIVAHDQDQWLKVVGLSYLFFSALTANSPQDIEEKVNAKERHLNKALKYMENNYHENITIESLAGYCNINRSHLSRLFKQEFGIGPKEYLLNIRMKVAANLLSSSKTAIKVVSISSGYENQLHFSKAFRQVHGMSPTKWRNSTYRNGKV